MTSTFADAGRSRARKPIDWWRWSGRAFLLFLLIFTVLPMRGWC